MRHVCLYVETDNTM